MHINRIVTSKTQYEQRNIKETFNYQTETIQNKFIFQLCSSSDKITNKQYAKWQKDKIMVVLPSIKLPGSGEKPKPGGNDII